MYTATEPTAGMNLHVSGERLSKLTDVHEGRAATYRLAYQKTLDEPAKVDLDRPRDGRRKQSLLRTAENRYLLNDLQKEASKNAFLMEKAAQEGETQDLGLASMDLAENLRHLWKLRDLRSEESGMVLNFLQTALAREVFEEFSVGMCQSIRVIVERHLSPAANQEDVDSSIQLLEGVGLDPWKAMAGFRE